MGKSKSIALRPTENAQGGYYFISLTTGRRLNRNHWTELPMPQDVINRIHTLARRSNANTSLLFTDRHGGAINNSGDDEDNNENDTEDNDDDDDNDMDDPHAALVHEVRNGSVAGSDRAALAYLLKYETMVRQQEAEDMAVMDHIRPCMERLNELAAGTCNNNNDSTATKITVNRWSSTTQVLSQEISYAAMATALQRLESTATDSNDNNKDVSSVEFMTTDRQLMMVLRLLTRSTLTGH